MSRCSPLLFTLLLLTSSAALSKDKAPANPGAAPDMPDDLQLIGWSADEKRFAVRVYDIGEQIYELDETPYCPGYVNHRGKKFSGALRLHVFEGQQATGTWNIQERQPCTPPDTARERLAQAKAALAQQGIDPAAIGTVAVPSRKGKTSSKRKGRLWVATTTTTVALPSGPWAGQPIEVTCRVDNKNQADPEEDPSYTSTAIFTVRLRSGRSMKPLGEFTLGPTEWSAIMAGHWTPTFDRLLLSPSGRSFVVLAHLDDGNMRGGKSNSVVLGRVELPERPESASPTSAPAR